MKFPKLHWANASRFMSVFIAVGVWILVMMFINFNAQVAENTKAAKDAAKDTKQIVTKQDETLSAIKQLATDNKLNSKQLGDTIICMLQVPIALRTTDVQEQCRNQALGLTPNSPAQTTPVANPPTPSSQPAVKDTSGEPSKAPPTQKPPTYTECVSNGSGILRTLGRVVSCL